jgi:hypothetical protein
MRFIIYTDGATSTVGPEAGLDLRDSRGVLYHHHSLESITVVSVSRAKSDCPVKMVQGWTFDRNR